MKARPEILMHSFRSPRNNNDIESDTVSWFAAATEFLYVFFPFLKKKMPESSHDLDWCGELTREQNDDHNLYTRFKKNKPHIYAKKERSEMNACQHKWLLKWIMNAYKHIYNM